MEPSWQPDPTGRHHYRWWDGSQWTDQVSVNGVVSTDPVTPAPTPAPGPPPPTPMAEAPAAPSPAVGGPPVAPTPGPFAGPDGPAFDAPVSTPIEPFVGAAAVPKRRTGLLIGLGVAAVVVAAGVAIVALGGGDSAGGTGVREFELETDDSYVVHTLELDAGDIVRVRVEPSRRLDTATYVLVDRDLAESTSEVLAEDYADLFTDDPDDVYDDLFTDADDSLTDGDAEGEFDDRVVFSVIDTEFEGDPDADLIVAFESGTYTMVIQSADNESNGEVRLIVEKSEDRFEVGTDDLADVFDNRFGTEDSFFSDDDEYIPED